MNIQKNVDLSKYTAYATGGKAEYFVEIKDDNEFKEIQKLQRPLWFLGYGANILISDKGLPGTVVRICTNKIELKEDSLTLIADSGVWWDDLVQKSVDLGLWGLELTSEIPGSVGAAVVGNIAAYGQAVKDTLIWIDVIDTESNDRQVIRLNTEDIGLGYRYSDFQNTKYENYIIVRAAFKLSQHKTQDLEYAVAVKIAVKHNLDTGDLKQRREAIIKAREFQGSIKRQGDDTAIKTTGSFFRNPNVDESQVDELVKHDDWGMSKEQILQQNKVHGGSKLKISAALVMLAAGFKAGDTWGQVRLHPSHVLKVENMGDATSQDIYDVTNVIQKTVFDKTSIKLEPEVRILGEFEN